MPTESAEAGCSVIVTGAARGIGRACALLFAQSGWRVLCADVDGAGAAAAAAAAECVGVDGAVAHAAAFDVQDGRSVNGLMDRAMGEFGAVDALVHAAGITLGRPFLELGEDDWARVVDVNLHGSFRVCQAVARPMAARGSGAIVLLSSVTGQRATSGRSAYAASKAAVESLARSMAVDLADRGVRVNCVSPGAVETPLAAEAHVGAGAFIRPAFLGQTPLRRYARPDEVAQAALFLASAAGSCITGHVLHVDGGFMAAGMLAPSNP